MSKEIKDKKLGNFLKNRAPVLLEKIAEVLPDKGGLAIIKNMISKDPILSEQEKEKAMKLLDLDIKEMENISKRWDSDMGSDSWLSKNTRPLTLMYLTLASTILMIIDSFHTTFDVDIAWVELLKTLLVTVYVAYFGSRGAEKITKIKK